MIYGLRSNGNNHGLVLTKPIVVKTMLDRVKYTPNYDLRNTKVIEPSAGDGAFAIEIIERLCASSLKFDFSFKNALSNLTFYELDKKMAASMSNRVESFLKKYATILPKGIIRVEDFLLSKPEKCDLIIGNPPYVRHEKIPEELKKIYKKEFSTFRHRSDLYIAFYEKGLGLLKKHGALSFICSNRWLKNQYGHSLRNLIHLAYSLNEIIDLEGTCPFEEEVIAYPAITTIYNSRNGSKAQYYRINDIETLKDFTNNHKSEKTLTISNPRNWFSGEWSEQAYEKFLASIESQGFKIGIGVATGSDKVFIRDDFKSLVENELLIPILTSKDLKNNQIKWSGNYIINPYDRTGKLIDLTFYPKAREYFELNKEVLKKRHVAQKNPKLWYKTIDKIKPVLTSQDKIVLPDISGNTHLFIDRGNYYPHHNLYYITGKDYSKLVVLAALLTSDFVKRQLVELGTTMNGGYPRWQSQNLKKLRIPLIDTIPQEVVNDLTQAYHDRDYKIINELVTEKQISNYSFQVGQTTLFEPGDAEYGQK